MTAWSKAGVILRWAILRRVILLVLLSFAPAAAQSADSPASPAGEITYLLDLIRASPCTFIRNGDPYDGPAAADHIAQKYAYYVDEIHSAEDFIDLAASRSLLSGRPYQVSCPGAAIVPASDWLRAELQAYRAQMAPNGGGTP